MPLAFQIRNFNFIKTIACSEPIYSCIVRGGGGRGGGGFRTKQKELFSNFCGFIYISYMMKYVVFILSYIIRVKF